MVALSNFKEKNYFYNRLLRNTQPVPEKIQNIASRKNLPHYLQTVLRLTLIQQQETPKLIVYYLQFLLLVWKTSTILETEVTASV